MCSALQYSTLRVRRTHKQYIWLKKNVQGKNGLAYFAGKSVPR
jgi:hypothetical protein